MINNTAKYQHRRQTVIFGNEKFMTYEFQRVNRVAAQASEEIENYLLSLPITKKVVNVENERRYQLIDVDLLWYFRSPETGKIQKKTIEVKGDRYYHTGNYFFETVSNMQKNTPGCFLITEADYIFYYFIDEKELHILETQKTREWFLKNLERFEEVKTSTSTPKRLLYTSLGRKVPRVEVIKNCGVEIINIAEYI